MEKEETKKYEVIKQIVEFQINSVFQTANLTEKGTTAYLAIFAALIAYFLTQNIPFETKKAAVIIGVIVSILAAIVGGSLIWGVQKGLKNIELSLKELDEELFLKLKVKDFINRGRIALLIAFICTLTLVFVFSIGLIFMLN